MFTNIPKSYKGKSPKERRKCKHQAFTDKSQNPRLHKTAVISRLYDFLFIE
ncbi:hypothetical protein FCR2A7T_06800 [Flavobacterium cauense R2A-7]|nr:hypothetical protein FCR2A7T_06800 [Flavobacterium cauense R2A-7]